MGCLFDHLTLTLTFFAGVGCSVLLGVAVVYVLATHAPVEMK
jgi:hypothetical protein